MFRNVLVALDGSASSKQALAQAIEIAQASGGRIGLLGATPRPSVGIWRMKALPIADGGTDELEREAQRLVDEAERAVPADVPVTKLLAHEELREHVAGGRWDLVVVGGSGRAGQRPGRRSLALRVLRASGVPVLVIPT